MFYICPSLVAQLKTSHCLEIENGARLLRCFHRIFASKEEPMALYWNHHRFKCFLFYEWTPFSFACPTWIQLQLAHYLNKALPNMTWLICMEHKFILAQNNASSNYFIFIYLQHYISKQRFDTLQFLKKKQTTTKFSLNNKKGEHQASLI
jgi:hypothetical protein